MLAFMLFGWAYSEKYRIWWTFAWKTMIFDSKDFCLNFCGETKPWDFCQ